MSELWLGVFVAGICSVCLVWGSAFWTGLHCIATRDAATATRADKDVACSPPHCC